MSDKIPTAEQFLKDWLNNHFNKNPHITEDGKYEGDDGIRTLSFNFNPNEAAHYIATIMREHTQLHVEAALKAASKVELDDPSLMPDGNDFEESREKSILNAYPKENIQ